MSFVYQKTAGQEWALGFYDPKGEFVTVGTHEFEYKAQELVAYLNGGGISYVDEMQSIESSLTELVASLDSLRKSR